MFKFTFDEKEYILNDENFDTLINDDEKPVKDIDKNTILELLNNSLEEIDFSEEFYIEACTKCLTGIKEKVTTNKKVAEKVIILKETETLGNINLDISKISTIADSQTITVNATLESNDESKDLYKNPTVTVKLPKEMTVKSAQYAVLYKNGLEVESTSSDKNSNGESEVTIKFKGEQEKYDVSGGTKIALKLDVATSKLTPSKTSQIEMTYSNENKYEQKTASADINFESQYGIMIYNQIVNYNNNGDTVVTVDKESAYGELSTNADQ